MNCLLCRTEKSIDSFSEEEEPPYGKMIRNDQKKQTMAEEVRLSPLKKKFANFSFKEAKRSRKSKPNMIQRKLGYDRHTSLDDEETRQRNKGTASTLQVIRKASRPSSVEVMGSFETIEDPLYAFLKTHTCYDLVPFIGKTVVFHKRLSIRQAFMTMNERDLQLCPIWDGGCVAAPQGESSSASAPGPALVDLITQTDFLTMLQMKRADGQDQDEDDGKSLEWWLSIRPLPASACGSSSGPDNNFIYLNENMPLNQAARLMINGKIHRSPVFEDGSRELLSVTSLQGILKLLYNLIKKSPTLALPAYTRFPIGRLKDFGTWSNLKTISDNQTLSDACDLMLSAGVSSLPIIASRQASSPGNGDHQQNEGRLVGALSKSDIISLLHAYALHRQKTVGITGPLTRIFLKFLSNKISEVVMINSNSNSASSSIPNPKNPPRSHHHSLDNNNFICEEGDDVITVMGKLVGHGGRRSVIVLDTHARPIGIVTVSDVLSFILHRQNPPARDVPAGGGNRVSPLPGDSHGRKDPNGVNG